MLFNKNGTGTTEIRPIATWTDVHDYEHIAQALILSERKIIKIVGKAIYAKAQAHYDSANYEAVPGEGEEPDPEYVLLDELVHKFQVVLVNFAYAKNMGKDIVLWGNSGINVSWSENFRPAQQETLDKLNESLMKDGYEHLDLLIEFMNENQDALVEFKQATENFKLKTLFINDAEEFSYYFNIFGSVSYFFEILDVIRRVQRTDIAAALGTSYADVEAYQANRLEIEASTDTVATVSELPEPPDEGHEVFLVTETASYYKWSGTAWAVLAKDMRVMLTYIKPALVDHTMFMKFYSDISNIKAPAKQLELLRANAELLGQKARAASARLADYVISLQPAPIVDEDAEPAPVLLPYNATTNSFMM